MAVVLATDTYETVRPVVRRLAEQTVKERLEVVIVVPLPPGALDTHRRELWQRLLGRPASESGRLCQGDGLNEGAIVSGGHGPQGNPVQFPDSHFIPTSIPSEFPRIAVNGRALGQDEIGAPIQTTSTSKVRRVDFGDCGPAI